MQAHQLRQCSREIQSGCGLIKIFQYANQQEILFLPSTLPTRASHECRHTPAHSPASPHYTHRPQEILDLRKTLTGEVEALRNEFTELKAALAQQLELTAGLASSEVVEAERQMASIALGMGGSSAMTATGATGSAAQSLAARAAAAAEAAGAGAPH